VQDDLVARRAALTAQSDEANALLARVASAPAADASRTAAALRASRALGRSALVAQPTVGTFTSGYGPRGGAAHNGIDIANAVGTPIVAVADGVVVDAGPASGFGQWVRVRHDDGTISTYGHVESIETTVGARVAAGQLIATMGNRGQSTGPHLHLEITTPGGGTVDPRGWLAERGVSV
jgi:murein DD-endopeptidase MepM/ murein hydrolase activator NlpD